MINHELETSINLKKEMAHREMQIDRIKDDYKSLGGIGNYYPAQQNRQRSIEEMQRKAQDEYQ
jgi:hypothetical protein